MTDAEDAQEVSGALARNGLREKWNGRYRDTERVPCPAQVLADNLHLLPKRGRALDLACGLGANALLLAERGLEVSAWDLSPVAIERLRRESVRLGLKIDTQVRDVQRLPPRPDSFDVIVVSHFLDRSLASPIWHALKPGGLLVYQTFTREAVTDSGPSNPEYRLGRNELIRLFPGAIVRFYREEGRVGDPTKGTRDLAMLVAQRAA